MQIRYAKVILFLVCLLPLVVMVWDSFAGQLGANPVESLTHTSGDWALRLLLVTLTVSPVRQLTGLGVILNFRRMLGLFAFFYAVLHFLIWIGLDQQFAWAYMLEDVFERPYITVGFAAFLMLVPLALTSNRFSMRRLGKRWKMLHKLVYPVAGLVILHYLWLAREDNQEPYIYGVILIGLLLFRTRLSRIISGVVTEWR